MFDVIPNYTNTPGHKTCPGVLMQLAIVHKLKGFIKCHIFV